MKWWCVFGLVELRDRIWRSSSSNYQRPLPVRLGVTPRGRSIRLERALTDFGCENSFAKAAGQVREHYGFEIGFSAVRDTTLEHSQRASKTLAAEYQKPFRALPPKGADYVIAQADGTMICTVKPGRRGDKKPREWKEMRLTAAQGFGKVDTFYSATFSGVDEVGRRWGHCAREAGWGSNSEIHAVADGSEWIRLQTQEVFGQQGKFTCDFYHVSGYLGAAAHSCRAKAPDQWRRTQQKRLKKGAVEKVIEALKDYLEPVETPEENSPVSNCNRYLTNRIDCLDYPRAIKLGLPIGSGLIESGHRHVLQARLKKAGTAWLPENADSIANLRVLRANGKWLHLWN